MSSSSSVQGARDKGTSGKFYDFDGNTRRIGTLDVTKTMSDADFHELKIRRERAYQWHARWAMPNYDQMKKNVVKAGPGLDSECCVMWWSIEDRPCIGKSDFLAETKTKFSHFFLFLLFTIVVIVDG